MGYIFQGLNLVPYLSVSENIALPCNLYTKRMRRISSSSLEEEIRRLAERLDFKDLLDRPVTKLSAGQQQRVAMRGAIIGQPHLVIADEPTSSLDRDRQEGFLQLLMEMCDEASATLLFCESRSVFDAALQQKHLPQRCKYGERMMVLLRLAYSSLKSRAVTTSLTVFSIALSVLLLVGVDSSMRMGGVSSRGSLNLTSHDRSVVAHEFVEFCSCTPSTAARRYLRQQVTTRSVQWKIQ